MFLSHSYASGNIRVIKFRDDGHPLTHLDEGSGPMASRVANVGTVAMYEISGAALPPLALQRELYNR